MLILPLWGAKARWRLLLEALNVRARDMDPPPLSSESRGLVRAGSPLNWDGLRSFRVRRSKELRVEGPMSIDLSPCSLTSCHSCARCPVHWDVPRKPSCG